MIRLCCWFPLLLWHFATRPLKPSRCDKHQPVLTDWFCWLQECTRKCWAFSWTAVHSHPQTALDRLVSLMGQRGRRASVSKHFLVFQVVWRDSRREWQQVKSVSSTGRCNVRKYTWPAGIHQMSAQNISLSWVVWLLEVFSMCRVYVLVWQEWGDKIKLEVKMEQQLLVV